MVLKGSTPLYASSWAEKTGISEVQPLTTAEWARRYAQAVRAATDAYLATLTDEDLTRYLDLSSFGLGRMTVAALLSRMVLRHIDNMCGEISVLKGLQGAKGYPI